MRVFFEFILKVYDIHENLYFPFDKYLMILSVYITLYSYIKQCKVCKILRSAS